MTKVQKVTLAVSLLVTLVGGLSTPPKASALGLPCADGDYFSCYGSFFDCPAQTVLQNCLDMLSADYGCSPVAMDPWWSGCYAFIAQCEGGPGLRCRVFTSG